MAIYFKDDNKFSAPWFLLEPDYLDVDSRVTFSEGKFVKSDDGSITCFLWVTAITNLAGACTIKDGGMPFKMVLHAGEYDFYDSKAKAKVKRPQTIGEKVLLNHFGDAFDFDAVYSGSIQLVSNEQLNGLYLNGTIPYQGSTWLTLTPVEALDKMKDLSMDVTAKKSSGYGSKAQSEKERLTDRWSFLVCHLGELGTDIKTVDELLQLKAASDAETMARIGNDLKLILDIMGD